MAKTNPIKGLEALAHMEYPGRFIIVGRDHSNQHNVIAYGLTGRSPPSQARMFVRDYHSDDRIPLLFRDVIRTEVTDPRELEKGSPALLIYPAIAFLGEPSASAIAVSNGAQTNLVYSVLMENPHRNPDEVLLEAFDRPLFLYDSKSGWINIATYEPDAPNFTPRISACVQQDKAALHMVAKGQHGPSKMIHGITFVPGAGKLIATYDGPNVPKGCPLPSFAGTPRDIGIEAKTPDQFAATLYAALSPEPGMDDFRVGIAVVYSPVASPLEKKIAIVNRNDLR